LLLIVIIIFFIVLDPISYVEIILEGDLGVTEMEEFWASNE
jgi:hypothetical protein